MKICKKICCIYMVILIIFTIFSNVLAADSKTNLNLIVVKNASETKYLDNDQGYISKSIINSNPETGEVTIELKLENTKKGTTKSNATEIMLVIDNSISMDFKTSEGKTRKSIILDSAKDLVNNIFNTLVNVKIGVVKFYEKSNLITIPTSNKDEVLRGLEAVKNKNTESGTNIQKGLISARNNFSKDAKNKVIILLTDGCPSLDANGNDVGSDEMIMTNSKYNTILKNTKDEILKIKESGIMLISLMTGINSNDVNQNGEIVTNTKDDLQAIETIFGTKDSPTVGKFYNVKTTDVNKVISEDITSDVQSITNLPINTIKIVDYFPEDITNNFDFSYVGNPSVGNVTKNIDTSSNTITWNIDTLKGNETATLQYKLKLKNMNNSSILDKVIATNEKVVLTYEDIDTKEHTATLDSSPLIKLAEVIQNEIIDNTIINGSLPQTGFGIGLRSSSIYHNSYWYICL